MDLVNLWVSFLAGLFAPLGAVCVLPLYPGFLSYLSGQIRGKDEKGKIVLLGFVVTFGVIVSMFIFGLIFTFILQESLTNAIGIVSPIAFGILALVSLLLIFDVDFSRFFPKVTAPILMNPWLSALIFGLFFGAIVLPCNPASLIVLFAISSGVSSFLLNLIGFVLFGLGMALPLLLFAVISSQYSVQVIGFLTRNKRGINLVAGLIMLVIAIYYLVFVFEIV
tara:strand:+ start:393 stop:1061 length:669 start_codon:yes stop_codon:yes gene_type:complete